MINNKIEKFARDIKKLQLLEKTFIETGKIVLPRSLPLRRALIVSIYSKSKSKKPKITPENYQIFYNKLTAAEKEGIIAYEAEQSSKEKK